MKSSNTNSEAGEMIDGTRNRRRNLKGEKKKEHKNKERKNSGVSHSDIQTTTE